MKRYVVCWPNEYTDRNGDTQTDFMRVGSAFPLRENDGFSIELNISPPTAKPGAPARLVLFPAKREDAGQQQRSNRNNNSNDNRNRGDNRSNRNERGY